MRSLRPDPTGGLAAVLLTALTCAGLATGLIVALALSLAGCGSDAGADPASRAWPDTLGTPPPPTSPGVLVPPTPYPETTPTPIPPYIPPGGWPGDEPGDDEGGGAGGQDDVIAGDLGGRRLLPDDNPWNRDISGWAVDPRSAAIIARIGASVRLHPDFGSGSEGYNQGRPYGIPYVMVGAGQAPATVAFKWPEESDPSPYPIPSTAPIERVYDQAGRSTRLPGDRHVIVVDQANGKLYELFGAVQPGAYAWTADAGARFDLASNTLRPMYWTSADAAGLPILPGLARADEVVAGVVRHALRFTCSPTRRGFVYPARHWASRETDPNLPPMGLRLRLKAGQDVRSFPPQARVIAEGLKRYGMILADNGSDLYVSGAPDPRWDDGQLARLKTLRASDFEVVEMGTVITSAGRRDSDYGEPYRRNR